MTLASRSIRKAFSLALAIFLAAVFLAACGKKEEKKEDKDDQKTEEKGRVDLLKGRSSYLSHDYETAARHFKSAADQGCIEAQFWFGMNCFKNDSLEREQAVKDAVKWIRKAADQDLAEAQFWFGENYRYGYGPIEKNKEEARIWLKKALDQGHPLAQDLLTDLELRED